MRNLDVNRLYICLVRECIPDFVMNYYDEGGLICPRPDFVERLELLYLDKNGKFIDLDNKKEKFVLGIDSSEINYYQGVIVSTIKKLYSHNMVNKKVSKKQAYQEFERQLVESEYVPTYGYKEYNDGKFRVKSLVKGRSNIYANLLDKDNK
jgi:2-oxoglutarate dehydrogenase complex dehydrogenase (E1) component-like enzyme